MRPALLLFALAGCAAPEGEVVAPTAPVAEGRTLWLASGPGAGEVDLHYARPSDGAGPRLMELRVALDGPRFLGAEALEAARAADKQLIVQDEGATLRVILMASQNLNTLDSGPLARLRFEGRGGLRLVGGPSIFAPPPANRGVRLGDPLLLGGR